MAVMGQSKELRPCHLLPFGGGSEGQRLEGDMATTVTDPTCSLNERPGGEEVLLEQAVAD